MSSVAVVGAGSVGVYFAAHLAAAGQQVVACVRRPFEQYLVESTEAPASGPARAVTDPGQLEGPVEWVLLCVKAHQTEGAAAWLARLCGPDTTVIVVQNGIEGAERTAPLAGPATVLPGVVYCGAELLEPGHIRHYSRGTIFTPDVPVAHRLAGLFSGTGAELVPTGQFLEEAWRKLATNTIVNGITALTLRDMRVMGEPGMEELARSIGREACAVARAEGADLPDAGIDKLAAMLARSSGVSGTSMLYDRRAGRDLEHDALYGAVIRAAERRDIDVPLHRALSALLGAAAPPTTDVR
ncbi:MAG: 2-dehydropantoate 2-reductase [Acidimicrobiales bacterium]